MSKGFKIALSIIGIVVAAFIVLAVVASNSSSHDSVPAEAASTDVTEVGSYERAELVAIIDKYARENLPDVTVPDILDDSQWGYVYYPELGYYNVVCEAKDSSGSDYLINAFVEFTGDDSYSIHYLHTQDGDKIDDGTVPD